QCEIWRLQMNRTYELMCIVRPDMADEDLDKLVANLESTVTSASGTIKAIDRMGKRRLAYMVRKFREGIYILLTIEGTGTVIHELERRLRVTEQVIKFLTVRVDEEQKRLEKIKALRDSRKKASAQPAVAAEEAPAPSEAPPADVPAATV
ncbi:MAG: 30S ribosomal protein S6, partial [Candidatus Sulfotelmatobacter sp.]